MSSTGSLNELVNSNDNHVIHTIIVEFCEPLGLSYRGQFYYMYIRAHQSHFSKTTLV